HKAILRQLQDTPPVPARLYLGRAAALQDAHRQAPIFSDDNDLPAGDLREEAAGEENQSVRPVHAVVEYHRQCLPLLLVVGQNILSGLGIVDGKQVEEAKLPPDIELVGSEVLLITLYMLLEICIRDSQ